MIDLPDCRQTDPGGERLTLNNGVCFASQGALGVDGAEKLDIGGFTVQSGKQVVAYQ